MIGYYGTHRHSDCRNVCDHSVVAIGAVILDIGGVLELNEPTDWRERWAERTGRTADELASVVAEGCSGGDVGSVDLDACIGGVAETLGLGDGEARSLMDDVWVEYLGVLNTELAAWFRRLRPAVKTGLLSNSFVGARERESAAYGFEELCDVVMYSHEASMKKPDPDFYLAICSALEVPPSAAVLLDDWPEAVAGAEAVGMHGVLFTSNDQAIGEIEKLMSAGGPGGAG